MADTKIKVQSSVLLAALKKYRSEMAKGYEERSLKYKTDLEKYNDKLGETIEKAVLKSDLSKFKITQTYVNGRYVNVIQIPINSDRPTQPSEPRYVDIDQEIKLLELADDQLITLNSDDSRVAWL